MIKSFKFIFKKPSFDVCRSISSGVSLQARGRHVISRFTDEEYAKERSWTTKKKKSPGKKSEITKKKTEKFGISNDALQKERTHADLKYQKITASNAHVNFDKFMAGMRSSGFRSSNNLVFLNGVQLVKSAMMLPDVIKTVYFTKSDALESFPVADLEKLKLVHVPAHIMVRYHGLIEAPVSALAAAPNRKTNEVIRKRLARDLADKKTVSIPFAIMCVDVRSETWLGRIIKSASLMGAEKIYALRQCADVWAHRTQIAAEGTSLGLPIVDGQTWLTMEKINFSDWTLVTTCSHHYLKTEDVIHDSLVSELKSAEEVDGDKETLSRVEQVELGEMEWSRQEKYLLMMTDEAHSSRNVRQFVSEGAFKRLIEVKIDESCCDLPMKLDLILYDVRKRLNM